MVHSLSHKMKSGSIIIVLVLISVPIISSSKLKLVQVICRHGDRTPIAGYEKWYPTDPYINEKYAPVGCDGLTEAGINRSFSVGQFLRSKYFSKLKMPAEYNSSLFRVKSSGVDRCKKSAEAILAGLFPGKRRSIPIYNANPFEDILFLSTYFCSEIKNEMAKIKESARSFEDDRFYEYLNRHLGLNATLHHVVKLQDTLNAQSSFGLRLPSWTDKIYPVELEKYAAYLYVLQSYNNKLKRINGGLWVREFIENMENVVNATGAERMLLYVGHEANIAGFLAALDIFQPHIPVFSSCFIIEMYQNTGSEEHYVKLFYKKNEKPEELYMPQCPSPCSFRDFKFLTKHLIPQNINQECGLDT